MVSNVAAIIVTILSCSSSFLPEHLSLREGQVSGTAGAQRGQPAQLLRRKRAVLHIHVGLQASCILIGGPAHGRDNAGPKQSYMHT